MNRSKSEDILDREYLVKKDSSRTDKMVDSLDENSNNKIVCGVTCDYDLKKIEGVDFETGKITISDEVFDAYKDEIIESGLNRVNKETTHLSLTCEGSKEIPCIYTSIGVEQWTKGEFGWLDYYMITPTDYEGYVFVPVNIQISRAEGTLHIVNE